MSELTGLSINPTPIADKPKFKDWVLYPQTVMMLVSVILLFTVFSLYILSNRNNNQDLRNERDRARVEKEKSDNRYDSLLPKYYEASNEVQILSKQINFTNQLTDSITREKFKNLLK